MLNLRHEPDSIVEYQGITYELNMAYDIILSVIEVLGDEELTTAESLDVVLYLLTGEEDGLDLTLNEKAELLKVIFTEQIGTTENEQYIRKDIAGNPMPMQKEKAHYSLIHDANFIYSSFMQAYNIDLIEQQGQLHWKKFKALMAGLPDDTMLRRIIDIRARDLPEGKHSEDQRKQLIKLKSIYALPDEEDVM